MGRSKYKHENKPVAVQFFTHALTLLVLQHLKKILLSKFLICTY